MTDTVISQNIEHSSWDTLYNNVCEESTKRDMLICKLYS